MRININPQSLTTTANKYLKNVSDEVSKSEFPLQHLDMKKLEGIQRGIPLFDGVSLEEIKFLTRNFSILNIARGCVARCSHCLRNAKPLQSGKKGTILWEDLQRFTSGFEQLNNRTGFDVLRGNDFLLLHDDFNPPVFSVKDINGTVHNYKDAVKLVFEKLNIPIETVTSGWTKCDEATDKAAKELVDYFTAVPQANALTSVSINPFHYLLEKSREFAKMGKPEQARHFREAYTSSIANAINIFLPLFKENKASVLYRYAQGHSETGAKELFTIYQEIYKKLQTLNSEMLRTIESLHPKNFEAESSEFFIEPKGRGRQFFNAAQNLKKQKELIAEKYEYNNSTAAQRVENAYKYTIKEADINGKIYCRTLDENMFATEINLNYKDKNTKTPEIFSDIKLSTLSKEEIIQNL